MEWIISAIIMGGVPSAFVGLVFWLLKRHIDKRDKQRSAREEEREKAREQSQILLIKSVSASIALGEATAIAMQNGKCNGETKSALIYAQTIKHEMKDFLTEQSVKNLF